MATGTGVKKIEFDSWEGGLNTLANRMDVPPNQLIYPSKNVLLMDGGKKIARIGGYSNNSGTFSSSLPATPSTASSFWPTPNASLSASFSALAHVDNKIYKCSGGTWTEVGASIATSASMPISFVYFNGKAVFATPSNGVYTYNGTTLTNVSSAAKGYAIAIWQNKLWVVGSGNTIYWSAAGDETSWTTGTDFVKVREKDDADLTAVHGGEALIVMKRDSAYRINDSTTGSYQTIDWQNGAVNSQCLVGTQLGDLVSLNSKGLWITNGISPLAKLSVLVPEMNSTDATSPFAYLCSGTVGANTGLGSGGGLENKVFVFVTNGGFWEYDVNYKWILKHDIFSPSTVAWYGVGTNYQGLDRAVTAMCNDTSSKFPKISDIYDRSNSDTISAALDGVFNTGCLNLDRVYRVKRLRAQTSIISTAASLKVGFAFFDTRGFLTTTQTDVPLVLGGNQDWNDYYGHDYLNNFGLSVQNSTAHGGWEFYKAVMELYPVE